MLPKDPASTSARSAALYGVLWGLVQLWIPVTAALGRPAATDPGFGCYFVLGLPGLVWGLVGLAQTDWSLPESGRAAVFCLAGILSGLGPLPLLLR